MTQQQTDVTARKIEGGYMIHVGESEEPLIGGPGAPGFLNECKRVADALGIRGGEVMTAIKGLFGDEVDEILNSPDPLEKIGKILDDGIAGEHDNKRLLFVLLLSALTMDPELCEMILFKSSSGGGKSTLANFLTKFYVTKKVGRLSDTALDHSDLKKYSVLYLQELGQMDNEEHGISTIKFLSSEDEGYSVEVTVRDEDSGDFTTKTKKIPPLTVISSTTRVNIDGQYERRNWILSVDETPEQTERIRQLNARHEVEDIEINLGLRSQNSKDRAEKILKAVVEAIEPQNVAILFPDTLMSVLTSKRLRIRGDFKKITRLLKYYAWLKQRTIPRIMVDGKPLLFPRPMDAMEILEVAQRSLIYMTQDLEGRDLKLLEGMEQLEIVNKGDVINQGLREELRLNLGYAQRTIRSYLGHLVDRGFLSDDGGKPKTYTLVDSLAKIRREISSVSDRIEDQEPFIIDMMREANRNLDRLMERKPELEQLRPYFTYNPEGMGETFFADSEQSPNNRQKEKIPQKDRYSGNLPINSAQNPIGKTTPGDTPKEKPPASETPQTTHKPSPVVGKKTEPRRKREEGQATLVSEPEPEENPGTAHSSRVKEDIDRFSKAVWNHQEEQRKGLISYEDLENRLGWEQERFNKVKQLVRQDRIPGVKELRPGYLGCVW